jgi:hypothetical protein
MTTKEEVMDKYRQERELDGDIYAIIHLISSPPPKDDSEAEHEKQRLISSCLSAFEHKYGQDLVDDIQEAIHQAVCLYSEKFVDGDYPNDD